MKVFQTIGPQNTAPALEHAITRAKEMGCDLVVATSSGASARAAVEAAGRMGFGGKLIAVTLVYGMKGPGENHLSQADRQALAKDGVVLVTAAHALSGAERAMSGKFQGVYPVEAMAHALRMVGRGVKVCVEIGAMALDAGAVPHGQPLVVMGGSGSGLDTACVMTPGYTADIFTTQVHEILCKPW